MLRPGSDLRVHTPGLLWRLYVALRGFEQVMVRPAAGLPLVVIAFSRRHRAAAGELRGALEETWLTIPDKIRALYVAVLEKVPPIFVVILRRKSPCRCLGHRHPPGTETRIARKLGTGSTIPVGEMDLAFEGIRQWQPLPLADLAVESAVGEEDREEVAVFRYRLALLDVFLHELNHYADPHETELAVRQLSQRFYTEALDAFMFARFGVHYGLEKQ